MGLTKVSDGMLKEKYVKKSGDTMSGALNMSNHLINNLTDGASAQDAVNKRQLDAVKVTTAITEPSALGDIGSAANATQSTINNKIDDKLATMIKSSSATLPATAGWYRIATSVMGIQRNSAMFEVDWAASGVHGSTTIVAGNMYGNTEGTSLDQIYYSSFNPAGQNVTKARIVSHATYANNYAYLEVYSTATTAVTLSTKMSNPLGWSLVTPVAGSIPSGYTSKELTLGAGVRSSGGFDANNNTIRSLANGVHSADAVNKSQLDVKLDKIGDASNATNTFAQATSRANLISGEKQSTIFGKLMKWFADLKPVAWSGNASDLTEDANNRLVTDSEKTAWNGKLDKSGGTMTGELMLHADPTQPLHPVTKQFADAKFTRNLLNDKDIGYNDTLHSTTPVEDILKEIFEKTQAVVGTTKPFEVSFLVGGGGGILNPNFFAKLDTFINDRYGQVITGQTYTFRMQVSTANGGTGISQDKANKCSLWTTKYYFEWEFDYDNFSAVVVTDAEGYIWNRDTPILVAENAYCANDSVTFSQNLWYFDYLVAASGSAALSDIIIWMRIDKTLTTNVGGNYTRATTASSTPRVQLFYIGGTLNDAGTTLTKPTDTSSIGGYVNLLHNDNPNTSDDGVTYTFFGVGKRAVASSAGPLLERDIIRILPNLPNKQPK